MCPLKIEICAVLVLILVLYRCFIRSAVEMLFESDYLLITEHWDYITLLHHNKRLNPEVERKTCAHMHSRTTIKLTHTQSYKIKENNCIALYKHHNNIISSNNNRMLKCLSNMKFPHGTDTQMMDGHLTQMNTQARRPVRRPRSNNSYSRSLFTYVYT